LIIIRKVYLHYNKRVEYFPEENIIIKGSGSATDPLDIAEEDTEIYSGDENPKGKKIANKTVDYTLIKRKLTRKIEGKEIRNKKYGDNTGRSKKE
jgi:hypothetical protein